MEIVATQDAVRDPSKQMVKADVYDAVPLKGQWSEYLLSKDDTWLEGHFGVVYGRHPLVDRGVGFEVVHLPSSFQPSH
jgi:hypothetical protein